MKMEKRERKLYKLMFPPRESSCSECGPFTLTHRFAGDICPCRITWASAGSTGKKLSKWVKGLSDEENQALARRLLLRYWTPERAALVRPSAELASFFEREGLLASTAKGNADG